MSWPGSGPVGSTGITNLLCCTGCAFGAPHVQKQLPQGSKALYAVGGSYSFPRFISVTAPVWCHQLVL